MGITIQYYKMSMGLFQQLVVPFNPHLYIYIYLHREHDDKPLDCDVATPQQTCLYWILSLFGVTF